MITRTIYDNFVQTSGQFDAGKFVEAFLIYETVLISSPSILPSIADQIGCKELCSLLNQGIIAVECGGPTAQAKCDYISPGFFNDQPLNRPLRYAFETIYVDPNLKANLSTEDRLMRTLMDVKGCKQSTSELNSIHAAALKHKREIDGSQLKASDDFKQDIIHKHDLLVSLLVKSLAEDFALPVHALDTKVKLEQIADHTFQIDTNLGSLLNKSKEEMHDIFKKRFFELTGTVLQLKRMQAVNAIAGLNHTQANITAERLDYLSQLFTEGDKRRELTRIVKLAEVPQLSANAKFDIDALIKLRNSDEASAFREWLYNKSPKLTDIEIKTTLSDWKKIMGETLNTNMAKNLRWLSSTGVGTAIGAINPAAGLGVSALDFFLGKFLPEMGPIGFIVGDYKKYIQSQK